MPVISWRERFENRGFFWNDELRDFIDEYGVKKRMKFFDGSDKIVFLREEDLKVGTGYGSYTAAAEYLQERVAPVGDFHGLHVELLLTETGRLIGFCDYLLISWADQHWRTAIPRILSGDEGFQLGVIPT